ncbi:hypothetical protein OGAPHI_004078 [Ogataea philodendri]|uniref:Dephospho-CoA kinase CAB5 n=1 Tax=Ogataea philodendri TaxID=1378263 RepID=A0A9P8P6J8_9ASCO|nr:uncharacterized protein OGAPHI_004078 [Ogataea philodendri]KAH3665889.1 hypothetical protein OGAPHI_004078 [Ogataea philodendri]
MLVIGLTGGIASGKSTVSKRLHDEYNITIIDADKIAREIVQPGLPAYNKIVKYFGNKVNNLVLPDRSLNRPALGAYVFQNKDELKVLNKITHGQVRKEMIWLLFRSWFRMEAMVVLDVPLLFEAGLDLICGTTLCVFCDPKLQLERLMSRNPELSRTECEKRIANQMPTEEKIARSDYSLSNDSTVEALYEEISQVISRVRPTKLTTILQYFPPIGALFALKIVVQRWWEQRSNSSTSKDKQS